LGSLLARDRARNSYSELIVLLAEVAVNGFATDRV